jgi:hypothetical protein
VTAHGFDKRLLAAAFAQNPTQGRDIFVEIVFFDNRVRPHFGHQLVFADQPIAVPDQNAKRIESPVSQRDPFAAFEQKPLGNVQKEFIEFV